MTLLDLIRCLEKDDDWTIVVENEDNHIEIELETCNGYDFLTEELVKNLFRKIIITTITTYKIEIKFID